MKDLIIGKRAKFSLLAALLACALTAGLAVGADEAPPPADKATATAAQAPPAAPSRMARHNHGDFAKKRAKFLDDTRDLRRQIAMKHAAMQALKRSAQPDVNLIQQFAGELFDLREQMRARAAENGLPPMMGGRMGHPGRDFMGHGGCMGRGGHGMMGQDHRHDGAPGYHGQRHDAQGGKNCGYER